MRAPIALPWRVGSQIHGLARLRYNDAARPHLHQRIRHGLILFEFTVHNERVIHLGW